MSKASNFANNIPVVPLAIVTTIVIAVPKILNPILELVGLKDSKESKEVDADSKSDYWNPNWYLDLQKQGKTIYLMNAASLKGFGDDIYNSINMTYAYIPTFADDEDKIKSVFTLIKYQTQISQLADWMSKIKGKDLFSWLRDELSADDMIRIKDIIQKKPTGIVK